MTRQGTCASGVERSSMRTRTRGRSSSLKRSERRHDDLIGRAPAGELVGQGDEHHRVPTDIEFFDAAQGASTGQIGRSPRVVLDLPGSALCVAARPDRSSRMGEESQLEPG